MPGRDFPKEEKRLLTHPKKLREFDKRSGTKDGLFGTDAASSTRPGMLLFEGRASASVTYPVN